MRIMGLDIGEKRIGIAISDPMGWTAQSHSVLLRSSLKKDLHKILDLCKEMEVERVVVGFPINMNGTIGPKALEVKAFASDLQKFLGLPVDLWDERLSTRSAERTLLEADMSRRKRKQLIDKLAAAHILQGYLDNKSRQ